MSRKYAKGRRAYGFSERGGHRARYNMLVRDGQTGLIVTRDEQDPRHPQETPVRDVSDPIALRQPLPNLTDTERLHVILPAVNPITFETGPNLWGVIELKIPGVF